MNCQQIQKLIHAHHDGELDAANTLQVDEHLADCPGCFGALRQLSVLRGALQIEGLRYSAPAGLRQTVRSAIAQNVAAERETAPARVWVQRSGWIAAAAMIAVSFLVLEIRPSREDDHLLAELTSSHVRSLMANHLTDVTSTDQHTVKPWFDGKLDFAPPVRDLRESGFPLIGGRLDFVDGRPAAALVYGRQKHFINLFVWPAKSATAKKLQTTQRNGYNLAQWSDGKMDFGVVSDLNETELRLFVSDWSGP
jgi:anti-sigma factor RsiW